MEETMNQKQPDYVALVRRTSRSAEDGLLSYDPKKKPPVLQVGSTNNKARLVRRNQKQVGGLQKDAITSTPR
jgi:hypothetical protein|tara:strand:- start:265 stop:480 length:216 start_codon:yes stop_codon:yes gene_type:complete